MSHKLSEDYKKYLLSLKAEPGKEISLKSDFETLCNKSYFKEEELKPLLKKKKKQLYKMQEKLYAHDKYSILIIFQAMDAAGKDGAIKHVMKGLNPQGVKVWSFKAPSKNELGHDYIWRHYNKLPARGEIGIFNRSHYENVLVTKVHPEYVINEKLPKIKSVSDITADFWQSRYNQINNFEESLHENGTVILKFFLHLSKDEQRNRFIDRIDNPSKNWKFSSADSKERKLWDKYMVAYERMISATSKENAPWFVIPADDKGFARLCIASIIVNETKKLNLKFPEVSKHKLSELQEIRKELMND